MRMRAYRVVMAAHPHAYAVNQSVGTVSDGITVQLLAVEVWTDRVVLSLGVLADEKSDSLLASHRAQVADWSAAPQGRPPRDPAGALVEKLGITLTDAAGTAFAISAASAGGTGTEWAANQIFTPAPTGEWLRVTFTSASGEREVRVELDA
jgi:hypothetical protein